jgi:hypothetical protein
VLKQFRLSQSQTLNSGAPTPMNSPFLISVAVALVTTGVATLWALLVAADMTSLAEAEPTERRDIRTW